MARGERFIPRRTPESAQMVAAVQRAMAITPRLNRLTLADAAEVRAVFAELTGRPVDEAFSLIPPFYTTGGQNIRVGRRVFVNQNCTMYDLGGIDIGDEVMIGPNVSLITSGHPVEPSRRREGVTAAPIVIGNNVWIGAGAIVIGGVTVGVNSVVAAGSVVTRDVPANTMVAGNPARVIRRLLEIREDDLSGQAVRALLALHLAGMSESSPPGHSFALDLSGLKAPGVTVWSAWRGEALAGIGALKALGDGGGEIKSMRAHPEHLGTGVGKALLEHIIAEAKRRGLTRLSLETGSGPAFEAALGLYRRRGFVQGGPFADYRPSDFNQFFHLAL